MKKKVCSSRAFWHGFCTKMYDALTNLGFRNVSFGDTGNRVWRFFYGPRPETFLCLAKFGRVEKLISFRHCENQRDEAIHKTPAFSLVEMLMALLVASLLLAALAPVMTRKVNENLHVTGDFVHNGNSEIVEIEFGGKYCDRIERDDDGNPLYCEGEYTVKDGYTNLTVTAIGAGGGGGSAPTAGFVEYIQEGSTNTFVVPNMVNEIEATLISGGAGGGAGGQVAQTPTYTAAGEADWNVPDSIKNNINNRTILVTACGAGGGGGGTTGCGTNCGSTNSEYLSGGDGGVGGGGGYIEKAITLANTNPQHIIIGGGGGGGARGVGAAYATGNSGSYGGGGGGGGDLWGNGAGYGGSGGAAGSAGGSYRPQSAACGLGGGGGDISSSTNGKDGVRGTASQGGTGSSNGGISPKHTDSNLEVYATTHLCVGGGGGGGSITGHGGGGGGGGAGSGGGGGGGGATIFGTRNNRMVLAPGGGGGGGGMFDDFDHAGEFTSLNLGRRAWVFKDSKWTKIFGPGTLNPKSYGSGGGGGGGGGEGGGNGGQGGRPAVTEPAPGGNGTGYRTSTIFGANNCNGGTGATRGNHTCPKQGGNGKPGAMRITYLDYGPGGSGGGSGQYVPIQPVKNLMPNDKLNVKIGTGANGGKAGKIEISGTITPAGWAQGGGGHGSTLASMQGVLTYISKTNGSNIEYILTSDSYFHTHGSHGASGPAGGSPTGQIFNGYTSPHYGCAGYLSDGKNYVAGNPDHSTFASKYNNQFISNTGKPAGNGSAIGAINYANKTTGGDGGETISPWFTCTPGKGGTESNPKGGDASGYGGCGGGGGFGLSDGGKGSGGYARLSWNMYWNPFTDKYEARTLGAGGGGARGNVIKETLRVKEGQVIKIRIGAGGIGAKVVNGELIPATSGGTTIFGDSNFIEIKAGGGGGGGNPYVKDGKLMKGEGGKPSNICSSGSKNYIKNKSYCTQGEGGMAPEDDGTNAPSGGLGEAFSYTVKGKTFLGQGGAGGIQSTESDNSKGGNAEGTGAGGGGAALLKYESLQNTTQLSHPRGGNGANGRIIIELWD